MSSVPSDFSSLTIKTIRDGLLAKRFSATELTQAALGLAQKENASTNAYLTFAPERALQSA